MRIFLYRSSAFSTDLQTHHGLSIARHQVRSFRAAQLVPQHKRETRSTCRAIKMAAITEAVTPHSGYHFDGTRRRFFEGWYFKVALPGRGKAFALIYSIEDPWQENGKGGVGAQVMGPDDGYMVQYSRRVADFWASSNSLALGASFRTHVPGALAPKQIVVPDRFHELVDEGYQASATWHQGRLSRQEAGTGGSLASTVDSASWAFSVRPVDGWGSRGAQQKATAGWLAAFPVFEPHWQVMMARGLATGWMEFGRERYEFADAPAYSEKNWGDGFPKKWFWVQCNTFDSSEEVAITAVGAIRGIKGLENLQENVGMLGIHWRGQFIELVPWKGDVSWEVEPWGSWRLSAGNSEYTAVMEATCADQGTPLRAPTSDSGLTPVCRDSFFGDVRLRIWRAGIGPLGAAGGGNGVSAATPLLDVRAKPGTAAVEVGGGPWYDTWKVTASMIGPVKAALNLPIDPSMVPAFLRSPGL